MPERIFEAQWDQAREIVHSLTPVQDSETVHISESLGRFLVNDIVALSDLPPFAASRIDGWAVSGSGPWKYVGDVNAGHAHTNELLPGQCVHIATGAAIPEGATACLKDEESWQDNGMISARAGAIEMLKDGALPIGHDIRPKGFEARAGDTLIKKGSRLTPGLIGILASAGYDGVDVYRQVTVDILIFGDELLDSGTSGNGKVRDSLGPQLPGWIDFLGAKLTSINYVEDTLAAHTAAINDSTANLIVTTGGTAAGPVDHLHQAISNSGGQLIIDAVKVRPGYHQLFAQINERYLLGLPGNPQSAIIGLLSLGSAFIDGSYARELPVFPRYPVKSEISAPNLEMKFVLSTLQQGWITPVAFVDSSMLRGFASATGYALVPAGGAKDGTSIRWMQLP